MSTWKPILGNYPGFASDDANAVQEQVAKLLGATAFEVLDRPREQKAEIRANLLRLNEIGLIHCGYGGTVFIDYPAASFIRQKFRIHGSGSFSAGALSGEISVSFPNPIIPADEPVRFEFKDANQLVLRIEKKALKRYLEVLIGEEMKRELVFYEVTNANPAVVSLRRAVFHFASDYNARGSKLSGLVVIETERILIMKFLMSNWHNYTPLLLVEPPATTVSAVQKAEEYIEANWDRPLDLAAISALTRVSARSLFRQFRKERGYSPAAFAKQMRLNRAKEMLERSDGATILEIAFKCGFQNPSHFARDFKLAFGELPSDVVKRLGSGSVSGNLGRS